MAQFAADFFDDWVEREKDWKVWKEMFLSEATSDNFKHSR